MTLVDQISRDVTTALKAGERERVGALRLLLSELQKATKEGNSDEQAILRRERKRRREAESAYIEAGRPELAQAEAFEAGVIESYMPAELTDEELDALVAKAVADNDNVGAAIGQVMASAGGRADGKRVATKVREAL